MVLAGRFFKFGGKNSLLILDASWVILQSLSFDRAFGLRRLASERMAESELGFSRDGYSPSAFAFLALH